ncbi:MAG: hypothetical protein IPG94_11220 [Kineosporiaceae bacterium]|nr:hypothetical protein [Kineosporiaceae bacterium]
MNGPGPIYDNALRQLAAVELVAVCRWLGIEAAEESVRVSEALPAVTRYADLLVTASGALTHVEFVRRVTPDLPLRMLDYRSRIHVIYLRDCDPIGFLGTPALAPLASLAQAPDRAHRAQLLRRALEVIRDHAPPHRTIDLASVAIVLAAIRLDAATIETARREAGMPISLEGTVAGEIIAQRAAVRASASRVASRVRSAPWRPCCRAGSGRIHASSTSREHCTPAKVLTPSRWLWGPPPSTTFAADQPVTAPPELGRITPRRDPRGTSHIARCTRSDPGRRRRALRNLVVRS